MNSVNRRALHIEIDLGAIRHNLSLVKQCTPAQNIFAVLKADAYGHGALKVAHALEQADGFAVVTLNEAIELREGAVDKPILVLQGPYSKWECADFVQRGLWPIVHCEEQFQWFNETADIEKLQPWIKIDTGMGRLGFLPDRAQTLLDDSDKLSWFGALTHFAIADEINNPATKLQIERFNALNISASLQKSLANSAGVLAWPDAQADWARPGIMLYGSNPLDVVNASVDQVRPAMRVSAPLIACKHYAADTLIGYAGSYRCPEAMTVGYVAIGYGDGMPRVMDRTATVWIAGQQCPIVGRVSMDSIAVDLRGLEKSVGPGDEVVLWGPEHPVEILAKAAGTIAYELLTSIKGVRHYTDLN